MPFDAEEAELLSATQSLCRWSAADGSGSGSVSALPGAVDSLRAIELSLRRDHPTLQPRHLSLGRWQTVQTALLPLMTTYKRDREVVYPAMKLVVRLTMPLPAPAHDSEQPQLDGRRERAAHQLQIRNALLEGAHLDVLMQWLTPLLARPPALRSADDVNMVELSLTLIKNLLAVSAGSNTQPSAASDDSAGSKAEAAALPSHGRQAGERIIRRYAECGVLDMLAAVCWQPEDLDRFGLLLLETVALVVGGVTVDELVAEKRNKQREADEKRRKEHSAHATHSSPTAGSYSYLWKGQSQPANSSASTALPSLPSPSSSATSSSSPSSLGWQLQTVRLSEKTRYVAPSRHSRFGTLLTLPSPLAGSLDVDLSAPPLSSGSQLVRNVFDMRRVGSDSMPAFRGRTPRHANSAAAPSVSGERSVCGELVEFVEQFVGDGCYQRLMDSALRELKANVRVVREDEKHWMAVAALMMGLWREQQMQHIQLNTRTPVSATDGSSDSAPLPAASPAPYFQCAPVMCSLSAAAFSLLTSKLLLYIQEKPSPLPFLTASLQLYSEIVHTLSCMLRAASPDDRESANQLRHAFYYEKEQLDLLVSLMRQWNAHSWGGPLMALLVECVHWSMAMLDDVDGTHTISQRRKKRVVKNRTVLVNGEKQKMPIAELQQALPANVLLDADTSNQQQRQQDEQQQVVPVMAVAVAVAVPAQPVGVTSSPQADLQPTELESQHPTEQSSAEDESASTQPAIRSAHSIETQADTVVYDAESTETPTSSPNTLDNGAVDTQASTLPLPADCSFDSTADTIVVPASTHGLDTAQAAADSVDSDAATQPVLANDPHDEEMKEVDWRDRAPAMRTSACESTLDCFATQLLPTEELLTMNTASVSETDASAAQPVDRHAVQPHVASPAGDVSDTSLSTLVSEMAIQPIDVVMDSIPADDASSPVHQARSLRSVEQPSTDTSAEAKSMADGDGGTSFDACNPVPRDLSPASASVQHDQFDSDPAPASDDEQLRAAAAPVVATAVVETAVVAPTTATVVATPAGVSNDAASSSEPVVAAADSVESDEQDVDEDGYFRMESTFNFSAYVLSYASPTILSHYLSLLAGYRTNSAVLNSHIVHFLSRIAFDRQLMALLFQLSFLQLCDAVLNDPLLKQAKLDPRWRELTSFCKKIVRGFFDWLASQDRGEMMLVECLFWKTVNAVELMRGGYRGGAGSDDRDVDDKDADRLALRQDDEAWSAEVKAQLDGDWQPGQHGDASRAAEKRTKSARKKKTKNEAPLADDRDEADDAGADIDIAQLMGEQSRREKERGKREKKEQKRREAEAKERERDRQRRAALAAEDDDEEEELQLGQYDEQAAEERRLMEQKERDEAAEAEGAEKEWRADEEELLRAEYPTFAALKSRYALMSSRLKSRFTQDEVKRKIKQLDLERDKVETETDIAAPPSPRHRLHVLTDMHTATTDEEQSESDPTETTTAFNSPLPVASIPISEQTLSSPPAAASIIVAPPRGLRAPSGAKVDVTTITGRLYDLVSDMARHKHHHAFIQHTVQTLTACAQQRQQHSADWRHFAAVALSPSLTVADSGSADSERRRKRQGQLLTCLALVRAAGGVWSVQRQYTADKLEAVVATMERAYENTVDGLLPDAATEEEEDADDEPHSMEQSADEQQSDADEEPGALAASSTAPTVRVVELEALIAAPTPRETRKRTAAQLSSGDRSDDPAAAAAARQVVHAEDEMDNAELADFLRQRRRRIVLHAAARSAPQHAQHQHAQRTQHVEDAAGQPTVAGRAVRGRLRKAAAEGADLQEETEGHEHSATDAPLSTALATETETGTKRRRMIVDDQGEDNMDVT